MSEQEVGGRDGVEAARLERFEDLTSREAHADHDLDAHRVLQVLLRLKVRRQRAVVVTRVDPLVLHHRLRKRGEGTSQRI